MYLRGSLAAASCNRTEKEKKCEVLEVEACRPEGLWGSVPPPPSPPAPDPQDGAGCAPVDCGRLFLIARTLGLQLHMRGPL